MQLSKAGHLFVIQVKQRQYTFQLNELVQAMHQLGFQLPDIEEGIVGLEVHGHERAFYGINRVFLYSQ